MQTCITGERPWTYLKRRRCVDLPFTLDRRILFGTRARIENNTDFDLSVDDIRQTSPCRLFGPDRLRRRPERQTVLVHSHRKSTAMSKTEITLGHEATQRFSSGGNQIEKLFYLNCQWSFRRIPPYYRWFHGFGDFLFIPSTSYEGGFEKKSAKQSLSGNNPVRHYRIGMQAW